MELLGLIGFAIINTLVAPPRLLLEEGQLDFLLLENGDFLLLE